MNTNLLRRCWWHSWHVYLIRIWEGRLFQSRSRTRYFPSLVIEPEGSAQLIQKPANEHETLTQFRPFHIFTIHLRGIVFNFSLYLLSIQSGRFPKGFSTKFCTHLLFPPIRITRPAHRNLLDTTTLNVLDELYKSRCSSCAYYLIPHFVCLTLVPL
jgi:hypothetical protein